MLEEIFRLARSGVSTAAFQMLRDVGALDVLVPVLEEYLGPEDDIPERAEPFWDLLAALDAHVRAGDHGAPSSGLIVALLYALPYQLELERLAAEELHKHRARRRSRIPNYRAPAADEVHVTSK